MPRSDKPPGNGPPDYADGTLTEPYPVVGVDDLTLAFPAMIMHLLPSWAVLTDEQRAMKGDWADFVEHWMFRGLPGDILFALKPGIDGEKMLRHMQAVLSSYQPKQEHKIGGLAFLCERWFIAVKLPSEDKVWGEDFEVAGPGEGPPDETGVVTEPAT